MTDHDLSKPDISKANDCPPLPVNASLLDRVVYWLGIGLGSGLPRRAPDYYHLVLPHWYLDMWSYLRANARS